MRIEPAHIGYAYALGFAICFLGLLGSFVPMMIAGPLILIVTWFNDDDPNNHVEPANMQYMDRDGWPVGRKN